MQIIKFNSIENLGIFKKFPKDSNSKTFERYNLIYGWNGSGKTTLSRLFQFVEYGANYNKLNEKQDPESYNSLNAEIVTNDTINNVLNINSGINTQPEIIKSLNIRVFNSEFIRNNINWDGKTNQIIIGQKVGDTKKEIENIEKIILENFDKDAYEKHEEIYIRRLKERYYKYINEIDKYSSEDYLTAISGEILQKAGQGTKYNNFSQKPTYNKADLKRFLDNYNDKSLLEEETDIIDNDKLDVVSLEIKKATIKPVFTYNFDVNTFKNLFFLNKDGVEALINKNVVSKQTIQELKDNPELQEWVKNGFLKIHENTDINCKFCGGELGKTFERLSNHFDTQFIEHENDLNTLISELKLIEPKINSLYEEIPKSNNLLDDYKEKYEIFYDKTLLPLKNKFLNNVNILIESLELKLKGEKKDAEKKIKEYDWVDIDFSKTLLTAHNLIKDNNSGIENFSKNIELKQRKIEAYYALQVFDTYQTNKKLKRFFENKRDLIKEIQYIKCWPKIKKLQDEKLEKEALLANTLIGAENINKILLGFWGDKIILKSIETKYQILRKSHNNDYFPAKYMSDGEKTVIAFCYFLISLTSKNNNNENNKIEDTIIVIDDPISSLADNYIYQIYSHIQNGFDNAKQLFILSHNFYFINLIKRWLFTKKRLEDKDNPQSKQVKDYTFLMIKDNYKDGDFTPLLSDVDNLLGKFHSEYHFLYAKLLEAKDNFELENSYGIPNMLRQFIETFLSFKVPNGTTSLETKMITLKQNSKITNISKEQIIAIARYTDFNSHREKIEATNNFTDILKSSPTILNDAFNLLKQSDIHHFTELDSCIGKL